MTPAGYYYETQSTYDPTNMSQYAVPQPAAVPYAPPKYDLASALMNGATVPQQETLFTNYTNAYQAALDAYQQAFKNQLDQQNQQYQMDLGKSQARQAQDLQQSQFDTQDIQNQKLAQQKQQADTLKNQNSITMNAATRAGLQGSLQSYVADPQSLTPEAWQSLSLYEKQLILQAWQAKGGDPNQLLQQLQPQQQVGPPVLGMV